MVQQSLRTCRDTEKWPKLKIVIRVAISPKLLNISQTFSCKSTVFSSSSQVLIVSTCYLVRLIKDLCGLTLPLVVWGQPIRLELDRLKKYFPDFEYQRVRLWEDHWQTDWADSYYIWQDRPEIGWPFCTGEPRVFTGWLKASCKIVVAGMICTGRTMLSPIERCVSMCLFVYVCEADSERAMQSEGDSFQTPCEIKNAKEINNF